MSSEKKGGDVSLAGNFRAGDGRNNGKGGTMRVKGGDGYDGAGGGAVTLGPGLYRAGDGGNGGDGGDFIISGGDAKSSPITLGVGATYVNGSVGNGANVGMGAGAVQSTVAVGSVVAGVPANLLAAALNLLREGKATLPKAAQAPAEELDKELEATAAAASKANSKDEAIASTALSRVGEGLQRSTQLLDQVEQAGGRIAHVGRMLKHAWDIVGPHLGM